MAARPHTVHDEIFPPDDVRLNSCHLNYEFLASSGARQCGPLLPGAYESLRPQRVRAERR